MALKILKDCGCTVETYQGEDVNVILKDLQTGFPDGIDGGFTYKEIAKAIYEISTTDRGYKKPIVFDPQGRDASHCGATDLYDWVEEALRKLVDSKEPFETLALNSKKELLCWQMSRTLVNGDITVTAHCWMDEGVDLVEDAMPEDTTLTYEQMEEVLDFWNFFTDDNQEINQYIYSLTDDELIYLINNFSYSKGEFIYFEKFKLNKLFDIDYVYSKFLNFKNEKSIIYSENEVLINSFLEDYAAFI